MQQDIESNSPIVWHFLTSTFHSALWSLFPGKCAKNCILKTDGGIQHSISTSISACSNEWSFPTSPICCSWRDGPPDTPLSQWGNVWEHHGRGLVSEIQPLISRCSLHNQIFGRDLPPFIWPTSRLCSLVHSLLRAFQIQNNIHGLFQSSPEWSKPTSPHATLQAGTIVVVCFVLLRIRNDPVSLYHTPSLIFHYWRSKKTERQATLDCKTSCSQ